MQYNTTASIPCNNFFSQNSNISSQTVVDAHKKSKKSILYETLSKLTSTQKKVAKHITYYANKRWGYCEKTYRTIARECDCSVRTVEYVMHALKSAGLATIKRMGQAASRIKVISGLFKAFNNLRDVCGSESGLLYINKRKNNNYVKNDKNTDAEISAKPNIDMYHLITLAEQEARKRILEPKGLTQLDMMSNPALRHEVALERDKILDVLKSQNTA